MATQVPNHLVDSPETYAKYLKAQRRIDMPAYDKRIKVRFKCAPGRHTICSQSVKPDKLDADGCGWVEMVIYESELPLLKQEVEPELESLRAAIARHRMAQRKHIATQLYVKHPDRVGVIDDNHPVLQRVPEDPDQWTPEMRDAERSYQGPPYTRLFRTLHERCIKTIRSEIEIVEKDIPPPLSREETLHTAQGEAMSMALAKALREVLSADSRSSSRKG